MKIENKKVADLRVIAGKLVDLEEVEAKHGKKLVKAELIELITECIEDINIILEAKRNVANDMAAMRNGQASRPVGKTYIGKCVKTGKDLYV